MYAYCILSAYPLLIHHNNTYAAFRSTARSFQPFALCPFESIYIEWVYVKHFFFFFSLVFTYSFTIFIIWVLLVQRDFLAASIYEYIANI